MCRAKFREATNTSNLTVSSQPLYNDQLNSENIGIASNVTPTTSTSTNETTTPSSIFTPDFRAHDVSVQRSQQNQLLQQNRMLGASLAREFSIFNEFEQGEHEEGEEGEEGEREEDISSKCNINKWNTFTN